MNQQLSTELAPQSAQMSTVFANERSFALAQRMAQALMSSTMLPKDFQGNMGDTLIILELGQRLGASPFMVAQNVDVIHGRPAMRAQFVIACLNASGRFSPLDFRFSGTEGQDDWSCQAFATSKANGVEVSGPKISIAMAKAEGWYNKGGSKWKTIPELMLRYRAGAWFGRLHAPDLLMGMQTAEEERDIIETRQQPDGSFAAVSRGDDKAAEAAQILKGGAKKAEPVDPTPPADVDAETGEAVFSMRGLIAEIEKAETIKATNAIADKGQDLPEEEYAEVEMAADKRIEAIRNKAAK